jgi:hypothetical protein
MKKIIALLLLISAQGFGQSVGGTLASGAPAGSFNITPPFSTNSAAAIVGAGTTLTITAPASIVNGNALVIFIAISGANSETVTFPAGFTQLGTTLSSVGSAKMQAAVGCKVANAESGNYIVNWNNNTNTAVAWMVNLLSTSCATDGIGTASGNASTLTATTFTPAIANDLFLVLSAQSSGALNWVNVPGNVNKIAQSSDSFLGWLPWGTGTSPAVKMGYTLAGSANANDSALFVIAFPSTTTSTATPFVGNSSSAAETIGSLNVTNGVEVGGTLKANRFLLPNGASCSSTSSTFDGISAGGNIEQLLCINSAGALSLDAGGGLTFVSTAGGARNGPAFLLSNGSLAAVSPSAAQDLDILTSNASGDTVVGCSNSRTPITCISGTEEHNIFENVATGFLIRNTVNDIDRLAIGDTKNITSGVAATILSIPLAADQTAGGTVSFSALATDTVNHLNCSTSGTVEYSGENSAGVFVVNTSVIGTNATACTVTLTNVCTFALTGANPALLQATCTLVNMATPTSYTITYNVNHLSGTLPTF